MEEEREYIKFQEIKFYWHPKYKYYLARRCGKILSLKRNKKRILKLKVSNSDYFMFILYKNGNKSYYYVHRFVYETFKGEIPKGMQTDHIDNNKKNNLINNLQLLSPRENQHKSNCKKVISFNIETKEEKIFDSFNKAAEFYQIHKSTVSKNCQKKNKITKSKKDGKKFQFFYL